MNCHYIPQFYLKGFLKEITKKQICVYDKFEGKHFLVNIKNIANESKLYSDITEEKFSTLEGDYARIFKTITDFKKISYEDKRELAIFIMELLKRNPRIRNQAVSWVENNSYSIKESIINQLDSIGNNNPNKKNIIEQRKKEILDVPVDPIEIWQEMIFINDGSNLLKILTEMTWIFLFSEESSFITSDNPIFIFNFGLKESFSELSIPLHNNICLWLSWQRSKKDIDLSYMRSNADIEKELNKRVIINSSRFVFSGIYHKWIKKYCEDINVTSKLIKLKDGKVITS